MGPPTKSKGSQGIKSKVGQKIKCRRCQSIKSKGSQSIKSKGCNLNYSFLTLKDSTVKYSNVPSYLTFY